MKKMKKINKITQDLNFDVGEKCYVRKPYFTALEEGVVIERLKNKVNIRYKVAFHGRGPETVDSVFMYKSR